MKQVWENNVKDLDNWNIYKERMDDFRIWIKRMKFDQGLRYEIRENYIREITGRDPFFLYTIREFEKEVGRE